jgi:phenylacetate-CoA ligase
VSKSDHYDAAETRDPHEREISLFFRLPRVLEAALTAPGWRDHLGSIGASSVTDRAALAALPILRKSNLPAMQKMVPPFAGLTPAPAADFARLFTSPGPIYEAEPRDADPWHCGRALFAAGFRPGDIVLNTFAYHLTPGGFIMDSGARAVGCAVIPAGPGNTEQQLDVIAAYRPIAYAGTPDFLNILLDAAAKAGRDASCIEKATVGGAAFPRSLQESFAARGIAAYQTFAVAEFGVVAYETPAREGLVVSEDLIVEIVRPGTGDPVPDGEVGEVVVTSLDPRHPMIRLALGDLSAIMPGASPCGRTNRRLRGWLGRADQTTKIKGMFVRPDQIAEIARRHPQLSRLRLVVTRENELDAMTLCAETAATDAALADAVAATLQAVTKLKGAVALVTPGSLPNDGKVIADERPA